MVLVPQCAARLNDFQLLAEQSERMWLFPVLFHHFQQKGLPPKPMVSPGKVLA